MCKHTFVNQDLKSWYGRSIVDGKQTLNDLFAKFASGDIGDDDIGDGYQTTKVSWRRCV